MALIIKAPSDMFQITITVNLNVGDSGFCQQTSYQNSDKQCNFISDKSEELECQTVGGQIVKQCETAVVGQTNFDLDFHLIWRYILRSCSLKN